MALIYSAGVNPVSKTIAGSLSSGATTVTIPNSTSLPTIPSGSFQSARITDPSGTPTEDITFTRSGTTLTLVVPCGTTLVNSYSAGAAIDFDVVSQPAQDQIKWDTISGGPHGSNITVAGALTLGIMNFVNLTSASATLTLANGSYDGQMVGIQMLDTCTKLATIDPAGSTTIDASLTRIMWAGEVAWLAWDLANTMWRKVAGKSIPMIGVMYLTASSANSVSGTDQPVLLDTSEQDNTGLMVNTGANKITIQRPGNYAISGLVGMSMGVGGPSPNNQGQILKAGTKVVNSLSDSSALGLWSGGGLKTVLCAAGNDITLQYQQNSGSPAPIVLGGIALTYLSVTEVPSW